MKKIMVFFLMLLPALILYGCTKEDSKQTIAENTLNQQGYFVEELTYDDPLFDVEITNIVIDVAARKINLHYNVHNSNSTYYTYYFVYKFAGQREQRVVAINYFHFLEESDYSIDLLFDESAPSEAVTVEMGRNSKTHSIFQNNPASNSAGFRYTIKQIEDRFYFKDDQFNFGNLAIGSTDGRVSFSVVDEFDIISSIKFVITDLFNNNQYVDEVTLDVIPSMRIDEKIVIYQVIFHNLSIGIRYQVSAYASGFDGIFEFNDVFVALAQAEFQ